MIRQQWCKLLERNNLSSCISYLLPSLSLYVTCRKTKGSVHHCFKYHNCTNDSIAENWLGLVAKEARILCYDQHRGEKWKGKRWGALGVCAPRSPGNPSETNVYAVARTAVSSNYLIYMGQPATNLTPKYLFYMLSLTFPHPHRLGLKRFIFEEVI